MATSEVHIVGGGGRSYSLRAAGVKRDGNHGRSECLSTLLSRRLIRDFVVVSLSAIPFGIPVKCKE